MTTLALKNGILAFDSRITDGDVAHPDMFTKAWVSRKHKVFIGGYGIVAVWVPVARYLEQLNKLPWRQRCWSNTAMPDLGDEAGLWVIEPDSSVYAFEGKNWYKMQGTRFAAGSGSKAALGAMMAGATAQRAVQIAIKLDPNSGPPVRMLKVADLSTLR